jgi:hypothetical protein
VGDAKCGLNNMSRQIFRLSHASLPGRSTTAEVAPIHSTKASLRIVALGAAAPLQTSRFGLLSTKALQRRRTPAQALVEAFLICRLWAQPPLLV